MLLKININFCKFIDLKGKFLEIKILYISKGILNLMGNKNCKGDLR